ncbi:MAG: cysteine desulfurase [Lachnospiraceae bacterium]|nr:cysteine desulfurase [Lachnospiraceae bacterium]
MERLIYMDNAATTPTAPEVIEAMLPFYEQRYGNPSAGYDLGQTSKQAIEKAREIIAASLGAMPQEIYFTAGGSESDNWALKGVAESQGYRGNHIITSRIEHHAILRTCEYLEQNGYEVTYLDVDEWGTVSPEKVANAIRPDTILISVMTANNEMGTIQPIPQIGNVARHHGVLFHTDAVQAYGQMPIHVDAMKADMLSASAHKFRGPKGVGFLYVRESSRIPPFVHGGGQERKNRAGTENVPGIVGMGKAAELAISTMTERSRYERRMRDYLIREIMRNIPDCQLNGSRFNRLPNNADFCFAGIEGGNLLIMLDEDGICASAGSACSTGEHKPSHVLRAMGISEELCRGAIRLTLNEMVTVEDIDYVVDRLRENIAVLRSERADLP